MATRPYLSIGEVLTLLKDEFPDVTISKIRFLESQGLLDPERTPSGYRKFYDNDVARLRWILRQQREHFLPLKVIKGRLVGDSEGEGGGEEATAGGASTAAEREAGFFEQVVMPMLKQRNPEARRQASETLGELARLGQQLRSAMLRNALRDYLEE